MQGCELPETYMGLFTLITQAHNLDDMGYEERKVIQATTPTSFWIPARWPSASRTWPWEIWQGPGTWRTRMHQPQQPAQPAASPAKPPRWESIPMAMGPSGFWLWLWCVRSGSLVCVMACGLGLSQRYLPIHILKEAVRKAG